VFEQLLGAEVHTDSEVVKVEKKARKKIVHFRTGDKTSQVTVDEIMVATGKVPRTDLGLENAGVKYDRLGIKVDNYMQTTNKNIYAAGDVIGNFMFTHIASYQSRLAAHNMFAPKNERVKASYHAVPRVVFIDPEVAAVGYSEDELKAMNVKYKSAIAPVSIIGRSNVTDSDIGFVKIIASPKDVVLGASIVAPRAGEMIHELGLAVQNHLKLKAITDTIHAFPTWSEAIRVAANKLQ
jgi:dihydrolipoamide dehydrogenase